MLKKTLLGIHVFGILALIVGCQSLKTFVTTNDVTYTLASDVLFDYDKAEILPQAQQDLKQAAKVIREQAKNGVCIVRIEGHTDAKGTSKYNHKLSERRARNVKDWFVKKEGLKNVKFTIEGFGKTKPIVANTKPDGSDDPKGRQKNRRVEIIVS